MAEDKKQVKMEERSVDEEKEVKTNSNEQQEEKSFKMNKSNQSLLREIRRTHQLNNKQMKTTRMK